MPGPESLLLPDQENVPSPWRDPRGALIEDGIVIALLLAVALGLALAVPWIVLAGTKP